MLLLQPARHHPPLALVFGYLVYKGATSINLAFFTNLPAPPGELGGGIGNAIIGTFILLAIAVLIGVPVGVLGAIYLSEYSGPTLAWWVRFSADILNGVPSIVVGHRRLLRARAARRFADLAGQLLRVRRAAWR